MKYFYSTILLFTLCLVQVQAQSNSSSPLDNDLNQLFNKDKSGVDALSSAANFEKIPFERAINPDTYLCGAGDVLSLNLVMPINAQYLLPISADGTLNIPRIGSVALNGKSLQQAEREILSVLNKKYSNAKGAISLHRPRLIYVTITGEVENPGMYTLTAATPVNVAYYLANSKNEKSATPANVFQQPSAKDIGYYNRFAKQFFGEEPRSKKSLRHIFIHRSTGAIETADLIKYQVTHEEKLNPMLREGDEVVVPVANYSTIGIYGAVQKPGEYEFVEGDNISTLLKMGFGLNAELNPVSAKLIRSTKDGKDNQIQINISEIERDQTSLLPGDKLVIEGSSSKTSTGVFAVKGEVKLPGVYPIIPGKTLLTDVIKMAGGFTHDAYPVLCEMYRSQVGPDGNPIDLDREYARNLRLSLLTLEDTLSYRLESRSREGIVSVDYYKLFEKNDASADVPVFDGDVLIVPRNTMSVQVIGMVANGGFIPWSKGAKLDYYIKKANGYLEDASKSRVRVVKANTRAWLEPDETEIEPGDIIWVHRNPQVRASNTVEVLGVLASVVAAIAGITSLAVQVLRK